MWPEEDLTAIRFLRVYFSEEKQLQNILNTVKTEIQQVISILKQKCLTDEIAAYIIKRIVLARIKYRIQNTHLNDVHCRQLSAIYRKYFKHMVGVASTFSNVGLSTPVPYKIKGVDEIQEVPQTVTLINYINNK